MYLALDIGNSNIVGGIFHSQVDNFEVVHSFRLITPSSTTTDELALSIKSMLDHQHIKMHDIKAAIFSSVVPSLNHNITKLMQLYFNLKIETVTHEHFNAFTIRYKEKEDLGLDRLVNIKAAQHLFGSPAIIIDFGTAITIDVLKQNSEYVGGLILPGVAISLDSLIQRTSQLPKVELEYPATILGNSTKECIQNGLYFLYKTAIENIIADINVEYFNTEYSIPSASTPNPNTKESVKTLKYTHPSPLTHSNHSSHSAHSTDLTHPLTHPKSPPGSTQFRDPTQQDPPLPASQKNPAPSPTIIVTGGLAPFITHKFTIPPQEVPFLTLIGLKMLLDECQ